MTEQEVEAKFYVRDLPVLEKRLQALGADCVQPRNFESNLRFDTPDGALTRQRRVLRLRQDTRARLTYKGPAQEGQEVSVRQEIEFEVSDFDTARHFLEALGYRLSVMYEKYRTTYHIGGVEIVLDELPFGSFIEIEGPDAYSIRIISDALRLNWEARCAESYLALFARLRQQRGLAVEHLGFEAFSGLVFGPQDFGYPYAD